jgi:hypothetical protein
MTKEKSVKTVEGRDPTSSRLAVDNGVTNAEAEAVVRDALTARKAPDRRFHQRKERQIGDRIRELLAQAERDFKSSGDHYKTFDEIHRVVRTELKSESDREKLGAAVSSFVYKRELIEKQRREELGDVLVKPPFTNI